MASCASTTSTVQRLWRSIAVDPNYALGYAGLADGYALLSNLGGALPRDRMSKAREAALKALSLDEQLAEAHVSLGLILSDYDYDFAGAEREYKRAIGQAHAFAGDPEEAMKNLDELKKRAQRQYVPALNFALIHIGLGERDQAFEWLEKAYEERSSWLASLKVEPLFDSIRTDPRFADLVQRVGL